MDDTLLFSSWEDGNLETWWRVVNIILLGVGLSLTSSKTSLIVYLNIDDLAFYTNILGCSMGSLPFNHLGLSIGGGRNRKEVWNAFEERFKYKIDGGICPFPKGAS